MDRGLATGGAVGRAGEQRGAVVRASCGRTALRGEEPGRGGGAGAAVPGRRCRGGSAGEQQPEELPGEHRTGRRCGASSGPGWAAAEASEVLGRAALD